MRSRCFAQVARGRRGSPHHRGAPAQSNLYTLYSGWAFRFRDAERRPPADPELPAAGRLHGPAGRVRRRHHPAWRRRCTLCVFPRDRLWDFFNRQPKLGYAITWLAANEEEIRRQPRDGRAPRGRAGGHGAAAPVPACGAGGSGGRWARAFLSRSSSSTSPTRWDFLWCTRTRRCASCSAWAYIGWKAMCSNSGAMRWSNWATTNGLATDAFDLSCWRVAAWIVTFVTSLAMTPGWRALAGDCTFGFSLLIGIAGALRLVGSSASALRLFSWSAGRWVGGSVGRHELWAGGRRRRAAFSGSGSR